MTCTLPKPIYASPYDKGLKKALPQNDGYTVYLTWGQALPSISSHVIGYNIYFSTNIDDVFSEGPKYFTSSHEVYISRFTPGDVIYFSVRATQYDPNITPLTNLATSPQAPNCHIYPETLLAADVTDEDLIFHFVDVSDFPSSGVFQIGAEFVYYTNVDYADKIIYADPYGRGYYGTEAKIHTVDGHDGYFQQNPVIRYFGGFDDQGLAIVEAEPRCESPHYPYTHTDGYKQTTKDILTTDLSASDEFLENFAKYDYSGYRRTSIVDFFSGKCTGSYIGGEFGCGDGYRLRGFNFQEANIQRQDMLLDLQERVILLRRMWTGFRCHCYRLNQEHAEARCPTCFGTGFVGGYEQFINPRESDGKIKMRFNPTVDDLASKPQGLEQNFVPNCWTIPVPTIKDRDIIIRFNQDLNEEFRYEVVNVTRNKTIFSYSGAQLLTVYRLDKTDIIYQWRAISDTSKYPAKMATSLSNLAGYGMHMHNIVINENITTLSDVNQTTSVNAGHCHTIINGVVTTVLGHTHQIVLL